MFMSKIEKGSKLSIDDIIANITNAFESLSGDEIAEIHNNVSCIKVDYLGDDIWEIIND